VYIIAVFPRLRRGKTASKVEYQFIYGIKAKIIKKIINDLLPQEKFIFCIIYPRILINDTKIAKGNCSLA
jgi:hypothetical protein